MYNLKTVNIGKNVNNVNSSAFSGCSSLTSIVIPESVTSIGSSAFYGCSSLTKTNYLGDIAGWCGIAFANEEANPIYYSKNLYLNDQEVVDLVIPNTVDTVISNTFRNCQSIKSVTIPESVTYLANNAFEGSGLKSIVWRPKNYINTSSSSPFRYIKDSIQSITFAETVDTIPNYMSYQMSNMKTLNIGQNVKHIGEWAFAYCNALDSIVIPEGVTSVYYDAFRYTAVKSITIPESITFLASDVFQNTSLNSVIWLPKNYNNTTSESLFHWIKDSVRTITFGDNVESIPYRMCYNMTNLTTINVGKNVKRIGKEAFYGVPFDDGLVYIGRVLYGYLGTMSANYNLILRDSTISIAPNAFQDQSNLLLVTFNEGLEEIGSEAFRNCQALLSLKFPNSLRSIDEAAFYDCKGLTMIKFGTKLEHLGANAFRYCAAINTSVSLPDAFSTIGRGVFEGCSNIPSIVIQGTVKRIEESAFNGCSKLTQLTLPNTVNYIGQYAMYNCSALKEIALPTALKKIDRSAFENNHTLTSLVIPNSVDTLAYRAFYNCDGLTSVQLGDGLRYLGGESFCESGNIRSVTFGKSLFNIDDRAFQNCGQLQAAHFNNNLTRIGVEAFRYCSNLRSVSFGEALNTIGERAFKRSGVTSIDLSKTHVTSLPTRVFRECFNLECIVFPTTLQTISSEAFYACSSLKILELPHGITSLDNSTFYGCSALTSVHIPNSVVTIMNNVFQNCGKLLSVTLPNSVMSIGAESFYSCSALKTLNLEMNAPISIGSNAFYGVNFTAINVPCGSKNTYLEDERWAVYADIMNEASLSNYELIALPTDGKSGVVDIQVPSCDSDGAYTLTAQPNYGYKFTHWNDGNTANPRQVVLTQDTSFIATMVRDGFAINAVANYPERGEVIGDTVALYGDTVTLTVIPNYGYYFDYWEDRRNYGNSDSQKKANPRQVIADKDTTYTAVLQKNPYNIKVNVANGEYGTVSSSTTSAYYLDTITITANPIVGYQLAHWNDGNTDNPRKFILTQDTVFTATFRQAYADKCGDNAYWSYDQQGTLTITGSGDMYNYNTSNAPWQLFKDSIQVINISDDITRIGNNAFYNIKGVKSLVIPTSLTRMGDNAIVGCDSLVTLVWNARSLSVQNLGGLNASRLQSITFGAEVVNIPDNICNTMRSLKHLVLPESVRTIGYRSFYDCDSLVYVSIPILVDSIGAEAFNACDRIDTIVWNAINVSKSSHGNLNRSTVSHIEFGSQVEYILNDMCNGMTKLQEVSIPESVKIIGSNAFRGCTGLKTLIIPSGVDSIYSSAFYDCNGLTQLTFNAGLVSIGSAAFRNCSALTNVVLPNTLETLGSSSFEGCSNLVTVQLPASMSSIGSNAFIGLKNLVSVTCQKTKKDITTLGMLGERAFYDCYGLKELQIPEGIRAMGNQAVGFNFALTTIVIPTTLDSIGSNAIHGCRALKSITIPAKVKYIGENALQDCGSLHKVELLPLVPPMMAGNAIADNVVTMEIPCGTQEAYLADENWGVYTEKMVEKSLSNYHILASEKDPISGVVDIQAPSCDSDGAYTLTAQPNYGYKFTHWNDGNTANPRQVVLTQDTSFIATMVRDGFAINAVANYPERGEVIGDTVALYGDTVTLTVIPNYGYYFDYWEDRRNYGNSDSQKKANPRQVIADKDTTYTAVLQKNPYNIKVNVANGEYGTVSSSTTSAYYLDTITITANPIVGYQLAHWNDGNTDNPRKFILTQDTVFTATFRQAYADKCGDNAYWSYDQQGTLTITGSGDMYNYNTSNAPWQLFKDSIQVINISDDITRIGSYAFYNIKGITSITIPESITSVGGQAFYNCSGLTSVVWKAINCPTVPNNWVYRSSITSFTFDDKVEVIPSYLCSGLSKLTSITLPENLTHIGNDAFYGCSSLASLVIPSKVIAIGGQAFYNCSQMTSLVVPSALNQLDVNAFYNTPIADLTIAANSLEQYLQSNVNELLVNTSISQSVLRTLSINGEIPTEIIVPNTITKVQNYAFYQMKDVKSVILPATITKIGISAFNTSSITSVTIPSTVDSIGQNVFDGSTLADVVITANSLEQYLQSNINMLLLNAGATISRILMVNGVEVINVIVPNGITEIKDKAFYMMRNITSVNIPESVTKMGIYAFAESKNLEVVKLPNSLDTIASYAFRNCVKLSTLELRDSIKHIDKYAFANCSTLVSVRLPEGLKSIEAYAFSHCTNLTEVHLPMLLPPTITATTFYNTTKLSKYYVPCGAKGNYTATINWSTYASKIYERYYTDYIITTASSNDAWGIVTLTEPTSCADTTYQFVAKPYYGYHFVQWQDGNTNNPRIIALTQDTAFIAEFARNTYIVSTESNFPERGTTSDPQPALYLDSVVIAATPNYGYHFTQWDDGNTDNPRVVVVTETITYNALFDKNPYTISINYNGEHGKVDAPEVALYMDEVEIEVKSKNGYHFTHWNDGNTDNPRSVTITQDTAFTVYFAINEYNIIVKANHEERGTTIGSGTYRHGDTLTISASANYGYYFSRWDNGVTDNPRQVVALDNTTYTALFAVRQFNITTQSTDDIRGQVKAPEIAEYLDEVTITAVPNYGYHFTHWNDGNTDNPRVFTLTQDTLFIASFDRNTYYVQAMPNNEVRGVTTGTGNYLYLDTVELSATSNYGFHFVQWQDAAGNMLSENSRYRVEVTEDVEYIARFDGEVFTITSLSTDDTRGHVEAPATAEYLSDITITAVPKFGYHFTHWNDGNTDNPRVFTLTQDTTFAASFEYTTAGECGEQTYWNYQDGELLISGAGEMTNYVETSVPWLLLKPQIKTVKITEGITSIGENAFYNCTHLTNVELPNSLLDIEAWAFADCPELTSFAIPTSIIEINQNAFKGCTSIHTIEWNAIRYSDDVTLSTTPFRVLSDYITTIIVGEQVAHIPTDLFPAMAALKIVKWNATAGEDYYTYDKTPFYHNRSRITNFTIGNNVTIIPAYLCYDMNAITSITLPNSVEQIEAYAFAESAISKIAMGTALTHIGYRAFANCEAITELTINSSVKTIDRYAFYNCQNLKTLRIGSGVTALGDHAFDECPRITDIYCYAVMPPVAESKTFYSYQPTLYVGYASGEAYHSDEVFKLFNNIIYYDYTALEDVVINGLQIKDGLVCCEQSFRIYDLIGNDVTHCNGVLQGIYIVRTDYASQKVVLISNTNH